MRSSKTLISVIALLVFAACPPASAEHVVIPASSYTATNNIAGNPVIVDQYGWLRGIDREGEWLEYNFDLRDFGMHSSSITVMGTAGVDFHLQVEFTGNMSRTVQTIHFDFTGSGFFGWGCEHTVAGSDDLELNELGYSVRLTNTVSDEIQLYSIILLPRLGTEHSSWGSIKKIHR